MGGHSAIGVHVGMVVEDFKRANKIIGIYSTIRTTLEDFCKGGEKSKLFCIQLQ